MPVNTLTDRSPRLFFAGWLLGILLFVPTLMADGKLGVEEHPGGHIPLDLPFVDSTGRTVTFAQILDGKPAILTLNYYGCPSLCTPQLHDLARSLDGVKLSPGKDYRVITLSFDPRELPKKAAEKKKDVLADIKRPFEPGAWAFLTGKKTEIKKVTDSVGFEYEKQVGKNGMTEYIHPAVLVALSPDGKITRYLNGVQQLPFDIQMALMEASNGTVRPTIAKTLLFCFAFDPKNKTYVFAAEKIGAITLSLILVSFFLWLVLGGRKKRPPERDDG